MRSIWLASLAVMCMTSSVAMAGAKTLKAEESIEVNANSDDVWAKVKDFGDLGAWHPAVKTTEIVDGTNNKEGAIRVLTLQDGGIVKEKLESYKNAQKSYSYAILESVFPVSSYHSTISVKPTKNGVTKVVWSGHFKRKDLSKDPAQGQGDEDAVKTMSAVYKGGLENLKKISE